MAGKSKKASKKTTKQSKVKKARKVPVIDDSLKRLSAIERAGKAVQNQIATVEAQDTKCGAIKADLEEERDVLSGMRKEQKELEAELLNLTRGGFSERLHFPDPARAAAASPARASTKAPAPAGNADPDAWKKLTLEQMGLKNKRALSALAAAGIETFGAAEERLGDLLAKPIPNFGDQSRQAYDDAKIAYFVANPPTAEKPKPHTAPGDKPGKASRGSAVDREKLGLGNDLKTAIAHAEQPVSEENELKLLGKVIGADPLAALEAATLEWLADTRKKVQGLLKEQVVEAVSGTPTPAN